MIVRWQSDLVYVNTKESVLPVCDKPYHTNKNIVQNGKDIGVLRTYAFLALFPCSYLLTNPARWGHSCKLVGNHASDTYTTGMRTLSPTGHRRQARPSALTLSGATRVPPLLFELEQLLSCTLSSCVNVERFEPRALTLVWASTTFYDVFVPTY